MGCAQAGLACPVTRITQINRLVNFILLDIDNLQFDYIRVLVSGADALKIALALRRALANQSTPCWMRFTDASLDLPNRSWYCAFACKDGVERAGGIGAAH